MPIGADYIYRLNFFTGFIVSALVYYTLCWFFPVPALSPTGRWHEVGDKVRPPSLVYGVDAEEGFARVLVREEKCIGKKVTPGSKLE